MHNPLFISPPPYPMRDPEAWRNVSDLVPMGLLYVAEACRVRGHSPMIVLLHEAARLVTAAEGNAWDAARWKSLIARVLQAAKPQAVGVQCHWSYQSAGALNTAQWIKEIDPTIHVTFGGVHAGAMAREILRHTDHVDAVVVGEGERTYPDLLHSIEHGGDAAIAGVVARRGDRFVGDGAAAPPLPSEIPRLSFAPDLIWPPGRGRVIGLPFIRGRCPKACTFCSLNSRHLYPVRQKSLMEELATQLPPLIERKIPLYLPDNFTGAGPLEALADALTGAGPAAAVFADMHPGVVTERATEALGRIAANTDSLRLWIGVELGSARVQASVMIGLPGETEPDVMATDQLLTELNDRGVLANVLPCVAFPETALFRSHEAFGIRLRMRAVSEFERLSTAWFAPINVDAMSFDSADFAADERVEATLKLRLRQRSRLGYRVTPELFRMMEHLPGFRVPGEAEEMVAQFAGYLDGPRFGGPVSPERFWAPEEEA